MSKFHISDKVKKKALDWLPSSSISGSLFSLNNKFGRISILTFRNRCKNRAKDTTDPGIEYFNLIEWFNSTSFRQMADNDHDQTWARKKSGMCNRVQDPKNVVQSFDGNWKVMQ